MFPIHLIINILCISLVNGHIQSSTPVILYSYTLSSGILRYQYKYENIDILPVSIFQNISKALLSLCNSKAYIFINIPGLNLIDFDTDENKWTALPKYINASSTAIRFKRLALENEDLFSELIDYTMNTCHIDRLITIRGDKTEDHHPYIDSNPRVIRIDFPELPPFEAVNTNKTRSETIVAYDSFIRKVLGTIPTPHHTVILTSLKASSLNISDNLLSLEIFPEIFNQNTREFEVERNDRNLNIQPFFNVKKPKFKVLECKYISAFNQEFVEQNFQLLQIILTVLICFISCQLIQYTFNI